MIIYSEKTKEQYKSVEECIAAEEQYDAALKAKEEEKRMWEAQKAERANEVAEAFTVYMTAIKKYETLRDAYVRDYGKLRLGIRDNEVFSIDS